VRPICPLGDGFRLQHFRRLLRSAAIDRFHVCFLAVSSAAEFEVLASGFLGSCARRLRPAAVAIAAVRLSAWKFGSGGRLFRGPPRNEVPVVVHDDLAVLVMLRQLGESRPSIRVAAPSCAPYRARTFSKSDDHERRVAGTTPFRLTRPTPR
jgi:hypothetical protein